MDRAKPFDIPKREVWEAYKRVRANQGAAGVDGQSIADFEADLSGQPLQALESAVVRQLLSAAGATGGHTEGDGRTRPLGIPTVADRIAQMVVKRFLEPWWSLISTHDSYGYRPGKSALDAVGVARQRCWRYDWVLDLDIKAFFDNIDTDLLMRAVRKHTDCAWVLLYIERWLKAPVQMADGSLVAAREGRRKAGSSVRSWPISFCTTRSTCGCAGTIRTSRSSAMRTMRSATATARSRRGRCAHRLRDGSRNAD